MKITEGSKYYTTAGLCAGTLLIILSRLGVTFTNEESAVIAPLLVIIFNFLIVQGKRFVDKIQLGI